MKETLGQILIQIRGAWRYHWYALAAAWVVAIVGWAAVVLMPNMYEARARVYVDTDSVLKPLLSGLAVNANVTSRVEMMARVIMGRPHLERVARETGLADRARTPEQFASLIDSLSKQMTLEGSGNVYSLHYSDRDPAMAQSVVQHLLDAFVEDTLGIKRADSGSAQQFLQTQIQDYAARLKSAEDRLADFKRHNVGLMPDQAGDYFTRLQSENSKLQDLQAKMRLADERRTEVNKQLQGEEPTFGLFSSTGEAGDSGNSPIDAQIGAYRRQLDQLLLLYTDKHPKVIALKETIAQLEAQKAAAAKAAKAKSRNTGPQLPKDRSQAEAYALDLNPVYQNLRLDLSRTEVIIAELRQQIEDEQHVVSDLKSRVNTIPTVEAQLTQLTRDYEVTRAQYQALLQRLDSARLSEQAEASNDQVKFRIIEPPTRPLIASSPNRPRLITMVLAAALLAGVALSILLSELNPVFVSRAMLTTITGLPVLGSISFFSKDPIPPLFRREQFLVGVGGACLLVAYTLAIGLAEPVSRLAHRLLG
ncbi:MAG: XrtA system polysaccharide chain length determinant [Steroidobacteraceae bacterium]